MDDTTYYTKKDFDDFIQAMMEGLEKGSKEYGYEGFCKNDVIKMAEEELRDLAVYAFLLFRKLKLIRIKFLKEIKEERRVDPNRT